MKRCFIWNIGLRNFDVKHRTDLKSGAFLSRAPYANALWAGLPLIGTLLGNLEGIRLPGHLREMNSTSEYLCKPGSHSGFKSE